MIDIEFVGQDQDKMTTTRQKAVKGLFFFCFGMVLGVAAKYVDSVSASDWPGIFINQLSQISSGIGLWILIATLIAVRSKSPGAGAMHVFLFFCGVLLTYYLYSAVLFGFFPSYYFLRWGAIALASPLAAYIVWHAKNNGWMAAGCAALPAGLLASEGLSFLYTYKIIHAFNLIAATILVWRLPSGNKQRLMVLAMMIIVILIFRNLNILPYLMGGL